MRATTPPTRSGAQVLEACRSGCNSSIRRLGGYIHAAASGWAFRKLPSIPATPVVCRDNSEIGDSPIMRYRHFSPFALCVTFYAPQIVDIAALRFLTWRDTEHHLCIVVESIRQGSYQRCLSLQPSAIRRRLLGTHPEIKNLQKRRKLRHQQTHVF